MMRLLKLALLAIAIFAILMAAWIYGLFHGYFDRGQFEVLHSWRSPTNEVAMLVRRLDEHQFLGGLEFYVLVGNRVFNPTELRRALYSNRVIFDTGNDCLTLRWAGPNTLIIKCEGSVLTKDQINLQRRHIDNISVIYRNIALQ
jgi:hypothetical protein